MAAPRAPNEFGWARKIRLGEQKAPLQGENIHDDLPVARHGSWNRSKKFGGDVDVVRLDKDGKVKSIDPIVSGFLQDNSYVGRPVDVLQMKDGSMLISDDWNGAVYRLTYGKHVASQ